MTFAIDDILAHLPQLLPALAHSLDAVQFIEMRTADHLKNHPDLDDPWLPIWHTAAGTAQGILDLIEALRELHDGE